MFENLGTPALVWTGRYYRPIRIMADRGTYTALYCQHDGERYCGSHCPHFIAYRHGNATFENTPITVELGCTRDVNFEALDATGFVFNGKVEDIPIEK